MKNNKDIEKQVIELRKKGYSRNEISQKLHLGHGKVQAILDKNNLSGKKGVDYRKKEVIIRYKKHIKKRSLIKKVEKPKKIKKPKYKKIERKKEKRKIEKIRYNHYVYAYIRYSGYSGMLLETGEIGTDWKQFYYKDELNDTINLVRNEAYDKLYFIAQSLRHVKFTIYYVYVKYDIVNEKMITRHRILVENGEI